MLSFPEAAVLHSIEIDGGMDDWVDVLADPFQTAHDGPWGGLADRDAPVPSTGRDLLTFAWTYDATALYFYVERVASESNRQLFWFYIDTDEDDLLEAGEPVVQVSWWGRNRNTRVQLFRYQPASPAGDPLGDPTGYADGWTLPGTVVDPVVLYEARGGSRNGTEMEAAVRWSDLGIAAGTAVQFHIASSNSENVPQQIHDNMGGPGGTVGTTRFVRVLLAPPVGSGTVVPAGDSWIAHTVTNLGDEPDSFDLTWTAAGEFDPSAVSFVYDADGDGAVGVGDVTLADTNGNGLPDTGVLPPSTGLALVVVVSAPAGVTDGQSTTVEVTATSHADPSVHDRASDIVVVAIPAITLVKTVDRAEALPGETLAYSVTYTSVGSVEARRVVVLDEVPAASVYVPGSAAGSGAEIGFSHDGGATFDESEAAPVTHIRWRLQAPLTPGDTGVVSFRVRVP